MTLDLNGHVQQMDAAETAGASRREPRSLYPDAAQVIRAGMHALSEKAYPWVTLALAALAWGYVLHVIATKPGVAYTPLLVGAWVFSCLTHVPTWSLWKKGR